MKFLKGEYVERVLDNAVGIVTEIQEYNGGHVYKVDLLRSDDDEWIGTADAWRPHHRVHAHVSTESRDCDGDYRRGHIDRLSSPERCESYGDLTFKQRVISSVVSVYAEEATLTVTPESVEWNERTEEGYTRTHIEWCEDEHVGEDETYSRDLRAEAMGY
jgi:hypothetical protein